MKAPRAPIVVGDGTIRIPLTMGLFAVIDAADLPLVAGRNWQAVKATNGKGFYARAKLVGRMHRVILGAKPDEIPDHRDGDGLNNRRANLRIGTRSQNSVNRKPFQRDLPVGVRIERGRYFAQITVNGVRKALGGYATPEEAGFAYLKAARELHGDWVHPDLIRQK